MFLTKRQFEALNSVVEYLAGDEAEDWDATGRPRSHIYNDVKVLARLLDKESNNGYDISVYEPEYEPLNVK